MSAPEVTGRVLLDEADLQRTLRRIAHEIVEKHPDLDRLVLVGIYTRGVTLAERLAGADRAVRRRRACPSARSTSPSTATTCATHPPAGREGDRGSTSRSTAATVVLVDDVLYTGRTIRAAIEALFDYGRPAARAAGGAGRPRPPRAADPPRLRRQEPAHRARRARERPAGRGRRRRPHRPLTADGAPVTRTHRPDCARRRHLLSIDDLDRADVERLLETPRASSRCCERDVKKVPTLRGRTVVNVFFEASTRTSARSSWPPSGSRPTPSALKASGSSVDKGESLKDTRPHPQRLRPGRDRDPPPPGGRARDRHPPHRRPRRQRRRRQAPAPDAEPARPYTMRKALGPESRGCRSPSSATSCTRAWRAPTSRR